jgi:hypothetical protein
MALDGTYETKLLRMLIGLLHISVTEQRGRVFKELVDSLAAKTGNAA